MLMPDMVYNVIETFDFVDGAEIGLIVNTRDISYS